MSNKIKFHLDENVSNAIAEGLRRRKIDVTTTPQSGLMGFSDVEQIKFAIAQPRVIFTQDDDFLTLHQTAIFHLGIVYCHQRKRTIGEIINSLTLIWEWIEPEDMKGKIEFI